MIKIYDFYAEWCGPCRMMEPSIKAIMRDYPHVEVVKVNVDHFEDLTARHKVTSIPTLVFFKDDVEVARLNGFASQDAIKTILKKY